MAELGNVEMERLWELAHQGRTAEELMQEMDLKDRASLKNALEELMRQKGETDVLRGLVGRPSVNPKFTKDGIRIPPALLEGTGFREGDEFHLRIEGDRITLNKSSLA